MGNYRKCFKCTTSVKQSESGQRGQKIVKVTKKGSAKRRPTLERPEASPNRSYIAYVRHQNRKMLRLKRLLTLRNAADEKKGSVNLIENEK